MKTFNLPDLGEGLQEAEIVSWHVKEGERQCLAKLPIPPFYRSDPVCSNTPPLHYSITPLLPPSNPPLYNDCGMGEDTFQKWLKAILAVVVILGLLAVTLTVVAIRLLSA